MVDHKTNFNSFNRSFIIGMKEFTEASDLETVLAENFDLVDFFDEHKDNIQLDSELYTAREGETMNQYYAMILAKELVKLQPIQPIMKLGDWNVTVIETFDDSEGIVEQFICNVCDDFVSDIFKVEALT